MVLTYQSPVGRRADALIGAETADKMTLVGEPAGVGDIGQREILIIPSAVAE